MELGIWSREAHKQMLWSGDINAVPIAGVSKNPKIVSPPPCLQGRGGMVIFKNQGFHLAALVLYAAAGHDGAARDSNKELWE